MLKYQLVFLFVVLTITPSIAARVFFDYKIFYQPNGQPYIECITSFEGRTFVNTPNSDSTVCAEAELTIVVYRGLDVFSFRKVNVVGPSIKKGEQNDFMSVERFELPADLYRLEVSVLDVKDPKAKPESFTQLVNVQKAKGKKIYSSDIELVSAYRPTTETNAFSKSGVDLLPYVSNYYPVELNSMIFYIELYNADSILGPNAPFVIDAYIKNRNGNIELGNRKIKRMQAAPVIPFLHTFDISKLATGNYEIVVEVRDKENKELHSHALPFSRVGLFVVSEEALDKSFVAVFDRSDSLQKCIDMLIPIATTQEQNMIDYQLPSMDLRAQKSFFYSFWIRRDTVAPGLAWERYHEQVQVVDEMFGYNNRPGYKTDRGRVYLQYGKPKTRIVRNHDPDYWPFEIWHYYDLTATEHDRRFLFYDTSLGGDMILLHSDATKEVKNHNWKDLVRSRSYASSNDASSRNASQMSDPYSGDEIEDLWYNPH
jgi:GWxTD domain-containing protein